MAKNSFVRLNFKIGSLTIQNFRVQFQQQGENQNFDYSSPSLNKLIGRKINNSFGGISPGLNLTTRSSAKTPMSRSSMYSGRSVNIHASNPNPQTGGDIHPRFNKTMYDTFMGKDSGLAKERQMSQERGEVLPFPFVSGMVGGHSYIRPGKKVFFNKRLNNKEVLNHQLQQINYNIKKRENDYESERKQDNEILRAAKMKMMKEQAEKQEHEYVFKNDYKLINENKQIENKNKKRMLSESKKFETYNFFPFTHGDEIEKKRILQKQQLTEEVRNKSQASHSDRKMMARSFTDGYRSDGYRSFDKTGFNSMKSTNGRIPVKYMTGYPAFLTPFKQYPYRRLNDTHVESVMQSAVQRYEESLKNIKKEREEDRERFNKQLDENDKYAEELEIKKKKSQMENKRMLLDQMQRESYNRLKHKLQEKEKVNTNFGPEENDATINMKKSFHKRNIDDIKATLEKQMMEKYQLSEAEKLQERLEELDAVEKAKMVMLQEREELQVKDKNAKQICKDAWKEQIRMKEIHKKTDNLFIN